MLQNNLLNTTSCSSGIKDVLLKTAGQLVYDTMVGDNNQIEVFDFVTDETPVIMVNEWWKIAQDRVAFPVANSVSSPEIRSTGMLYFAGYIMNDADTTIPVYQNSAKVGVIFDLYAACIAAVFLADYQMANIYLQSVRLLMKYYVREERIEEVGQAVIDDIDCYTL